MKRVERLRILVAALRRFAGISLDAGRSTTLVLYGNDLATLKVMVVADR